MESEFLNRLGKLNINNGVDFKSVEASSTSSSFRKVPVERIQLNTPVKDDKVTILVHTSNLSQIYCINLVYTNKLFNLLNLKDSNSLYLRYTFRS